MSLCLAVLQQRFATGPRFAPLSPVPVSSPLPFPLAEVGVGE